MILLMSKMKQPKKEFNQLKEQLNELLEQKKYAEALAFFLEGIGIPREVIDGMFRQSPQWNSMLKIAPTLAYDTMLASDLAPLKKSFKSHCSSTNHCW